MADENVSTFQIIDVFKDDMFIWILDPNSTPQSKRYLLSKFIQEMRISYAIDTGIANAYAIALNSILTSYVEGQSFSFKAVNANTGASTINIDGLGVKTIKRRDGTDLKSGDILAGSINIIQFDGTNFQLLSKDASSIVTPTPVTLADGAAIAFDLNDKFFDYKRLDTVESTITLTLSNIIEGANQILSVKKNIAGNVTITLAGGGLSFYGYNDAALGVTPDIILSGASGDVFDISFLARTATEIGVAVGLNGN